MALSFILGPSRISPVWKPFVVPGAVLVVQPQHLSTAAELLSRMVLARPFVAESLYRREPPWVVAVRGGP